MEFSTSNPPLEHSTHRPTHLSPNNCHYYLSLLERFVKRTQQEMPDESVLKLYLVRAEYRYYRWFISGGFKEERAPPLDVAFFWQTHMLRPGQFERDVERHLSGYKIYNRAHYHPFSHMTVPLRQIHECQEKIPFSVLNAWRTAMGRDEPYHLTPATLVESCRTSCAKMSCIICFVQMDVGWSDFVEWRLDHTVALACHRCGGRFTNKHVGKANLLNDIGSDGYLHNFVQDFKLPPEVLQEIKRLPFNSGLLTRVESFLSLDIYTERHQREFVEFVESTYLCHPYKASFDLIYAVARQYKFAYKITKLTPWKHHNDLKAAVDEYFEFLDLVRFDKEIVAVPSLKADLIWHMHMLNPLKYHCQARDRCDKVLNHNDAIPEDELAQHVKYTQEKLRELRQRRAPKKNTLFGARSVWKKKQEAAQRDEKGKGRLRDLMKSNISDATLASSSGGIKDSLKYNNSDSTLVLDKGMNDLLKFNNSDEIMKEKFGHLMRTKVGFSGTSTCCNIERLDRWDRSETPASKEKKVFGQDPRFESYSKVFYSTGKTPHVPPEILAQVPYNSNVNTNRSLFASMNALPPDTTEEPFDWEKVSVAWANIFGLTADEEDAANFRAINQQGNLGASCGVLTLYDRKPLPPSPYRIYPQTKHWYQYDSS